MDPVESPVTRFANLMCSCTSCSNSCSYSRRRSSRRTNNNNGSIATIPSVTHGVVDRSESESAPAMEPDQLYHLPLLQTQTMRLMTREDSEATTTSSPPSSSSSLPVIMSNCPSDLSPGRRNGHDDYDYDDGDVDVDHVEKEDGDLMGTSSPATLLRSKRSSSNFNSSASSALRSSPSSSSTSSTSSLFNFSRTPYDHHRQRHHHHHLSLFTILSLFALFLTTSSRLSGVEGLRINQFGGYEDIVVSVGSEVPPITCQQLVQNLQVRILSSFWPVKREFSLFCFLFYFIRRL